MSPPIPWTPQMKAAYDRYKRCLETGRAYGRPLPAPGATYPEPQDEVIRLAFFSAFATDLEWQLYESCIREDMIAWKERIAGPRHLLSKLEFNL